MPGRARRPGAYTPGRPIASRRSSQIKAMDIQPVVVGTAGHIDHGKSSLVRALTGIDPDRLREEKERGMTIDLGFARFELPDGRLVGIVDVPGHERFIRNMVAGATGIDLVVLVVAADDGVMPQTREHLQIMELCGVARGFVALTKVDLVERDLVDLAREELIEFLQGTFLEGAPIHPVSAITGEGMDEFRQTLEELVSSTEPRSSEGVFRMPVQRVFSAKGFGTICTGIPIGGELAIGDTLEVLPQGRRVRVRGLQAYGREAKRARAGHSTAINLADIDHHSVQRGDVLAEVGVYSAVRMLGARFKALPNLRRPIQNRTRIRLHVGTADVPGEMVLLDQEECASGASGLIQLRLDEAVVCAPGDPFVLRLLSPAETLGGGVVVEESRHRLKRFKNFVLEELVEQERSLGSARDLVEAVLHRRGLEPMAVEDLVVAVKSTRAEVAALLSDLQGREQVRQLGSKWLHKDALEAGVRDVVAAVKAWFEQFPLRQLMDVRELKQRIKLDPSLVAALLEECERRSILKLESGGQLRLAGREIELDAATQALSEEVHERLAADPFQPPLRTDLVKELKDHSEAAVIDVLALMLDQGRVIHLGGNLYLTAEAVQRGRTAVVQNFERNGKLEIPQLRDALQTSRKFLIPLLEYFDRDGLTIRQGAHRVLRRQ